jgi:uncharacterized membrane protein
MVNFSRWFKHLFTSPWTWRRAFPKATLDAIEAAIRQSETHHSGEIRFAIETSLAPAWAWRGMSGRERAVEMFSHLRVWDTADNSGVLVYLLLADHDIQIVADRGIAARVNQAQWDAVARAMEAAFRQGEFERGALEGIRQIDALLTLHFPSTANNPDELADRPVIITQ